MENVNQLMEQIPAAAADLSSNLSTVLQSQFLSPEQIWSVALASSYFVQQSALTAAVLADAQGVIGEEGVEDAHGAAAIMGMNAVYYRFRHMISKESYSERMAGLRMNRMVNPATSKIQFELCSLACAAIAGCEACLQAHEANLVEEGLTEDQVHDTIRIAAVIQGVAVAIS
jgi:alkyl hydroperoxide reductase subunit D